ncbi:MAG: prenyltransferase/squalene oxidase repeat-containing protein [Candidatus Hodarchaeota archaeon]
MYNIAAKTLTSFLSQVVSRPFDSCRLARAGWAAMFADINPPSFLLEQVSRRILQTRQQDGGWSDPLETAWATGFLAKVKGKNNPIFKSSVNWLKSVRYFKGGWGKHSRDQMRIPDTSIVIELVPEATTEEDRKYVTMEWQKDLKGIVRLSYKAGFFLLTAASNATEKDNDLVVATINHLSHDQNDDGGFAPWRGHPIGSDPWSTGVVLWGLSRWVDQVDRAVLEKALNWLQETQLPSGYWPYHYLDDGTSLALIGSVAALKSLKARE